MKTLITSLFLLLTFFSASAQDLDFVHSYGSSTEGSSNDKVRISKYYEESGKILVAGRYYEQINLELGSTTSTLLAPNDDISQGFIAIYENQDLSLSNYLSFNPAVSDAILISDSTVLVMGVYGGLTDLDPRPEDTLVYDGGLAGSGFIGYYNLDGTPYWVATFNSAFGVGMNELTSFDEEVLVSGYFFNADFEMNAVNETITFENESGTDSFIFGFNKANGELVWYKKYSIEEGDCTIQALNSFSTEFVATIQSSPGTIDIGIDDEENDQIIFEEGLNSFIGVYEQQSNLLSNYSTLESTIPSDLALTLHSGVSNDFGVVSAYYCRGDNLMYNSSSEDAIFSIQDGEELDYLSLLGLDAEGLVKWLAIVPHSELEISIADIAIDKFGFTYAVGYYQGVVFYEETEIFEENASPLNNGFIMKLDPLGNLTWAHNIPSQQGELEVNSVSVNEEQDILISGYYTGNHDFDLSENTQYVGNFEEENGFLARYTQELNEAQVFLNVPILHTEIEEGGANSLVYASINREIDENVIVEATPDEQIDLGNGAGQPVELIFTPNGEKIMSLDVTAFDDLDVEGDHTGTITFSSSGETNFASLDAQTVTFDIIDNDPDAIVEQNVETEISIYPNPATNEITIDYPENLSGKTIDLIRIIDANGRVVFEIKDHPKNQKLSVEDLRRSSYIMQVNTGKNEFTTKLLLL